MEPRAGLGRIREGDFRLKAFYCIPSARPVEQVIPIVRVWKERGYGVALWRDNPYAPEDGSAYVIDAEKCPNQFGADLMFLSKKYPGYARCVNTMAARVLSVRSDVDWIVCGGDDTFPDPKKTGDEIADELTEYFLRKYRTHEQSCHRPETFGVCQPTGDRWNDGLGVIIDRIAGSPWLGREWCRRAHAGKGPLWPEFSHMFVDEALQLYAQSLGVFLQRQDLTHYHDHAQRDGVSRAPAHMDKWNTLAHWDTSKAIFERLKSTNFAECQPIS